MKKWEMIVRRPGNIVIRTRKGFTLIEIIATIVIGSIFGAMVFRGMGTSAGKIGQPLNQMRDHYALEQVANHITAAYKGLMTTTNPNLITLRTWIDAGTFTGADYTTATKFVDFDAGNTELTPATGNTILKVTITRVSDGQNIVMLFTQ